MSEQPTFDVAIIGGGIMGLCTAYALAFAYPSPVAQSIVLLEAFSVDHERASSHDLSRILRLEYGRDALYAMMVERSFPLWQDIERRSGRQLYVPTGILTLDKSRSRANSPGTEGHAMQSYRTLTERGHRLDILDTAELAHRFPQFASGAVEVAVFNPFGGYIRASLALRTLRDLLVEHGVSLREGAGVQRLEPDGHSTTLVLSNGDRLEARRVVVTAGPATGQLLDPLFDSAQQAMPITPTRQHLLYLQDSPQPEQFSIGTFPIFLSLDDNGLYGFPIHEQGVLKTGSHLAGPRIDPYNPGPVDTQTVQWIKETVDALVPALAHVPVAHARICTYAMTPDEDFILDHLPTPCPIVVGAGFSGHGFKFGPLIGQILAALVRAEPTPIPIERFSLSRFA